MKLTGDLVKVYTAKEDTSVDHVNATGTPSKRPHVEQIDDNGNLMTGDADQLYYDDVNGIAILIGNAFVHHQNQGEAQGAKLTYNTPTGDMVVERDAANPITMTFFPKQKSSLPTTSSRSPAATAPSAIASKPDKE